MNGDSRFFPFSAGYPGSQVGREKDREALLVQPPKISRSNGVSTWPFVCCSTQMYGTSLIFARECCGRFSDALELKWTLLNQLPELRNESLYNRTSDYLVKSQI